MINFKKTLRDNAIRAEQVLTVAVSKLPDNEVNRAIIYSLKTKGKRLRPALVYETAKLFGKDDGNIDRIAAAVEMIHTYSLIHDDLPCMDDDDFRRGMPSCHKKFGEAVAVLAGDGLLNFAAEVLLGGVCSENYFKAIGYIFECSGIFGMVGGQAIDISDKKPNDLETLDFLTENKTSKLMMAAMVATGIYCGGSAAQLDALATFAENFGKAFQASDDLLDCNDDDKVSYVKFLGKHDTKVKIAEYNDAAKDSLKIFGSADFFEELCDFNASRQY